MWAAICSTVATSWQTRCPAAMRGDMATVDHLCCKPAATRGRVSVRGTGVILAKFVGTMANRSHELNRWRDRHDGHRVVRPEEPFNP
jgi:hypothetical protein